MFDKITLETFLKKQHQLYDEEVAQTKEEAEEFLEDCMAVVLDSEADVLKYLDEIGMDVDCEIDDIAEVFRIPNGRFLIVEA
ncbi:MAG: glyoxalase [Lachnospiraceae bacterium]|nr:glyoxalase [Lachnospiraceae bacterium]